MKKMTGLLSLTLSMVSMAASIDCVIAPNRHGVKEITFTNSNTNPRFRSNHFDNMEVVSERGLVQEYRSDSRNAISGFGITEQSAIYSSLTENGVASIQYIFFVLPNEPQPETGRKPANGVKMKVILPPATEVLDAECLMSR
jgi:hypothetical protein